MRQKPLRQLRAMHAAQIVNADRRAFRAVVGQPPQQFRNGEVISMPGDQRGYGIPPGPLAPVARDGQDLSMFGDLGQRERARCHGQACPAGPMSMTRILMPRPLASAAWMRCFASGLLQHDAQTPPIR